MKRIIVFLICTALTMTFVTPVFAASSGKCGDNLIWTLNVSDRTLSVSGYGTMWNWEINAAPWKDTVLFIKKVVIQHGVESIGSHAFSSCRNLTSVTFSGSVKSIGTGAFSYCDKLSVAIIPDSVTTIEKNAFFMCTSLSSLTLNSGLLTIGESAFSGCKSLTHAAIPQGVLNIGSGAFVGCDKLETVTVPSSVTHIGDQAFSGLALKKITVDKGNSSYQVKNGILFSKDMTKLIMYPAAKTETTYSIPETVTTIGAGAFNRCTKLTNVTIPPGVSNIGSGAFSGCSALTSVALPKSLINIASGTFANCKNLVGIALPSGLITISSSAFLSCTALSSVVIPHGATTIAEDAFANCKNLTDISIPETVTHIGKDAFYNCSRLTNIYYGGTDFLYNMINGIKEADIPSYAKVYCKEAVPGTVLGYALRTDITATINGHAIPSYNVGGVTYIIAEDLNDYGFSVYYDDYTRTLSIIRDYSKTTVTRHYEKPHTAANEIGRKEYAIIATDIKTHFNSTPVSGYNINGQTIIRFDLLSGFAPVSYDNTKRLIYVNLPDLS